MTPAQRPLSPHLSIYKPQLTSVLSISHRATGVVLSIGTVFLVWWLVYRHHTNRAESSSVVVTAVPACQADFLSSDRN